MPRTNQDLWDEALVWAMNTDCKAKRAYGRYVEAGGDKEIFPTLKRIVPAIYCNRHMGFVVKCMMPQLHLAFLAYDGDVKDTYAWIKRYDFYDVEHNMVKYSKPQNREFQTTRRRVVQADKVHEASRDKTVASRRGNYVNVAGVKNHRRCGF